MQAIECGLFPTALHARKGQNSPKIAPRQQSDTFHTAGQFLQALPAIPTGWAYHSLPQPMRSNVQQDSLRAVHHKSGAALEREILDPQMTPPCTSSNLGKLTNSFQFQGLSRSKLRCEKYTHVALSPISWRPPDVEKGRFLAWTCAARPTMHPRLPVPQLPKTATQHCATPMMLYSCGK